MANPTLRMTEDSGRSSILGVTERLHARLRAIARQVPRSPPAVRVSDPTSDTSETDSAVLERGGGTLRSHNEEPSSGTRSLDALVADELPAEGHSDSAADGKLTGGSIERQCSICDEWNSEPLKTYRDHEVCEACYTALTR